jgi:tRNA (cmo5U34)-methyltransferase
MSAEPKPNFFLAAFNDPDAAARYADGPRRFVPALAELHRMTGMLLAERAPQDAHVLVLGAGGGLELKAMANAYPDWRFTGVDPAAAMLTEAGRMLGTDAHRATFVEGYIDDAPPGPFDAATCLLTLHFLGAEERRRTLAEIHRRLRPGAPFVAAHTSFPQHPAERDVWLSRYAAWAASMGVDPEYTAKAAETVAANLALLTPEHDEAILRDAGFADVRLFYAALTWRGWIAVA